MGHIRQFTTLIPQPIRFGLRQVYFRGTAHQCVLCGNKFRAFLGNGGGAEVLESRQVVGGMHRAETRCPVCHAVDRTRMIMLYLEACTDLGKRPVRMLHVAPEVGLYLWLRRQPQLSYVGTDIDTARYRHIEGIMPADLTDLPFPDDHFDLAVCSHVLEHVPNDTKAFSEIHRTLRPGGKALLLTPYALDGAGTDEDPSIADPAERDRRFGQWDHVRLYCRDDFLARMRSAGFRTELFDPCRTMPERARDLGLNPLELLPIGIKGGTHDGSP